MYFTFKQNRQGKTVLSFMLFTFKWVTRVYAVKQYLYAFNSLISGYICVNSWTIITYVYCVYFAKTQKFLEKIPLSIKTYLVPEIIFNI